MTPKTIFSQAIFMFLALGSQKIKLYSSHDNKKNNEILPF